MTFLAYGFVAVLTIVVLGLAVELSLRLKGGMSIPLIRPLPLPKARSWQPLIKDNAALTYHPGLGWTLTPFMTGMVTDALGCRLPSSEQRPLQIGHIVASGNPFAAGSGVGNADSWPALVEARIGIPVINAACGGWGADQVI